MPDKVRVHDLASELNILSRQILVIHEGIGEFAKSASSTVDSRVAARIRRAVADVRGPANRSGLSESQVAQVIRRILENDASADGSLPGRQPQEYRSQPRGWLGDLKGSGPDISAPAANPAARIARRDPMQATPPAESGASPGNDQNAEIASLRALVEDLLRAQRDTPPMKGPELTTDKRKVFLVHGRNMVIRGHLVDYLEALDLRVVEWDEAVRATGQASPYTGDVVRAGMDIAYAVVVLLTPDDIGNVDPAHRHPNDPPHEYQPTGQARMNVIFEAGMAMALDRSKTVLVEVGAVRPMTDTAGVNLVRLTNSVDARRALANRLGIAGLAVDMDRDKWRTVGDFTI